MRLTDRVVPISQKELDDVQLIIDDVGRFLQMGFHEWVAHIEQHPEDKFCEVDHPQGRGHLNCSRAAYDAFDRLTDTAVGSQIDRADFDYKQTKREVRRQFTAFFLRDRREDDEAVREMLLAALHNATESHRARTHWLPCVVTRGKRPSEVNVGPVRFLPCERFFEEHQAHFDELRKEERETTLAAVRDETKRPNLPYKTEEEAVRLADKIVQGIVDYFAEYEWVAEVQIPPCASRVSWERAVNATQGGLDVIKMHLGGHARGVRLAHERALPRKTASWWRDDTAARYEHGASWQGESILGPDTWFEDAIEPNRFHFDSAGAALRGYVDPAEDVELGARFRDALFWYGQAISERVVSAKIVKYAACLERLTITAGVRGGIEGTVVKRVGFLSGGTVEHERKSRKAAALVYKYRSLLLHGRTSPFDSELVTVSAKATRLAQSCLFGYLTVCWWLSQEGAKLTEESLEAFFNREFKARQKAGRGGC